VLQFSHLGFSELLCLLGFLFCLLILTCFLYSLWGVELSSTMIVLARLKVKSLALLVVLLLSLKNLLEARYLMVEERVLD
jgi:hypothetical protein